MSTWSQRLLVLKPSQKFMFGLAVMSLPIAYILKVHLDWKPKPDSKKRMLIHHGVFWLSCFPGLKFFHNGLGEFEPGRLTLKQARPLHRAGKMSMTFLWLGSAVGTMIGGFEGGGRLARYLVPKQPKPAMLNLCSPSGAGSAFPVYPAQAIKTLPYRPPVISNRLPPSSYSNNVYGRTMGL